MKDFYIKPFKNIQFLTVVICLFLCIFTFFRYSAQSELVEAKIAVESLLRNDYLSGNSYAISKSITDLENLKIIKCVKLIENTEFLRIFHDTSRNKNCIENPLLKKYFSNSTKMMSISGTLFTLEYQLPLNYKSVFLEFCLYILSIILLLAVQIHIDNIKESNQIKIKALELEKELVVDITKQVKHDVASPIGALRTIVQVLNNVDPDIKSLLEKAVSRTEEIFKQLNESPHISIENTFVSSNELNRCIIEIIDEKNVLWKNEVSFTYNFLIGDAFNIICSTHNFKRIISNLLNNCYEAMQDAHDKKIQVEVKIAQEKLLILIKDNGKGIPEDIINKIGEKGFSFGKRGYLDSGSGIGVYMSKQMINSWGGQIFYTSQNGKGTEVSIFLNCL